MEEIIELRNKIDQIDDKLSAIFAERLEVCREIGEVKQKKGIPIEDIGRENAIIDRLKKSVDASVYPYVKSLYKRIFTLAKGYQKERSNKV